jgi:predicted metalloendopeptidase
MSAETKTAIEKLNKITIKIGYLTNGRLFKLEIKA